MAKWARIPYTDRSKGSGKVGYAYGQPINRYWVVLYKWNESSGQYERELSSPYINRRHAWEYMRSINITNDIPRVELWGKVHDKPLRMFTYKGLK